MAFGTDDICQQKYADFRDLLLRLYAATSYKAQ